MNNGELAIRNEDLAECEEIIRTGTLHVAAALLRIKDRELFKEAGFDSFASYYQERLKYSRSQISLLLKSARVVEDTKLLTRANILTTEKHVRAFSKAPDDRREEVLETAIDVAADPENVTSRDIAEAVKQVVPPEPGPPPPSQDEIDLHNIQRAFSILAGLSYSGDQALEKFGDLGQKMQAAIDWILDLHETQKGEIDIPIRLSSNKRYHPKKADMDNWADAYPTLDIAEELRRCAVWNDANPMKRKTASGINKHVVSWLTRASERHRSNSGDASAVEERLTSL